MFIKTYMAYTIYVRLVNMFRPKAKINWQESSIAFRLIKIIYLKWRYNFDLFCVYLTFNHCNAHLRYRDKCQEVSSSLKQRAQLLGEFVSEQMSGLTQDRDCTMPSVNLHLADLMVITYLPLSVRLPSPYLLLTLTLV